MGDEWTASLGDAAFSSIPVLTVSGADGRHGTTCIAGDYCLSPTDGGVTADDEKRGVLR